MNSWKIIRGDCVETMRGMDPASVDLVFADPPYNIGIDYGEHYDDDKTDEEYVRWCFLWMKNAYRVLKSGGSFWLLCNHEYVVELDVMARRVGFHRQQWITWYESFGVNCSKRFNRTSRPLLWYTMHTDKFTANHLDPEVRRPSDRQVKYNDPRANPAGKIWDDVWGINPPIPRVCGTFKERIKEFPTQLPLKLLRPVVAYSSNPGDLVLDPFSGSATTGAVCVEKSRRYIGIELSEKFADLSIKRLTEVEGSMQKSA